MGSYKFFDTRKDAKKYIKENSLQNVHIVKTSNGYIIEIIGF